jgi:hypothetical protein
MHPVNIFVSSKILERCLGISEFQPWYASSGLRFTRLITIKVGQDKELQILGYRWPSFTGNLS